MVIGLTEVNIGVDATRNRSGGAVAHVKGIILHYEHGKYDIKKIVLWGYKDLLDQLPNYDWLIKVEPKCTSKNIISQLWWQFYSLPKEAKKYGCNVLFNTDAGTVCTFTPCVTLSQDMLSFEKGEMDRYWFGKSWVRLFILKYVQLSSLKRSNVALFLTDYARKTIETHTRGFKSTIVVNHGINERFLRVDQPEVAIDESVLKIVYISNAAMYKHQWKVVEAVYKLNKYGVHSQLLLVGGGQGTAQELLDRAIERFDPKKSFVIQLPFVENEALPEILAKSHVFLFASSCENMPITLMEGMASGLPVACSNRGPMPEVLKDTGIYFDPENPDSIFDSILKIKNDERLGIDKNRKSRLLSQSYTWKKCSEETWKVLSEVSKNNN
ncbi:glycosyl transferase family 1 [Vibrio rotiferianus]|nr:glycosyl transferase family 1 [Vibrio rotiferianus]